jgi:hypothetical protein
MNREISKRKKLNHGSSDEKPSDSGLIFSSASHVQAGAWQPKLRLDPAVGSGTVTMKTLEILPLKPGTSFLLEPVYTISAAVPRSLFNILQQYEMGYTFVFSWPEPDNSFFREISGMRQVT